MLNQLARFEPVLRLVHEIGGGSLLDVGSGSVGLRPWLGPGWRVTAVDSSFDDYGAIARPGVGGPERVVANALELPFEDRAYDVTVALDLVEHLPASERPALLAELGRVTRRRLIVACPTGEDALAADSRLAEHYRRRGRVMPGWLVEHLAHGFPEPEELGATLGALGQVRLIGNESIRAHELIVTAESGPVGYRLTLALSKLLARSGRQKALGHSAAAAILHKVRGQDRPPTYRTIAVVDLA